MDTLNLVTYIFGLKPKNIHETVWDQAWTAYAHNMRLTHYSTVKVYGSRMSGAWGGIIHSDIHHEVSISYPIQRWMTQVNTSIQSVNGKSWTQRILQRSLISVFIYLKVSDPNYESFVNLIKSLGFETSALAYTESGQTIQRPFDLIHAHVLYTTTSNHQNGVNLFLAIKRSGLVINPIGFIQE